MNEFSFFKAPVRNVIPETPINLSELHELIISDKYKAVTHLVRNAKDKASQNAIKSSRLDYVTLSGLFDKRHSKGLISHSGLICLDLDGLKILTLSKI